MVLFWHKTIHNSFRTPALPRLSPLQRMRTTLAEIGLLVLGVRLSSLPTKLLSSGKDLRCLPSGKRTVATSNDSGETNEVLAAERMNSCADYPERGSSFGLKLMIPRPSSPTSRVFISIRAFLPFFVCFPRLFRFWLPRFLMSKKELGQNPFVKRVLQKVSLKLSSSTVSLYTSYLSAL